jgi:5-methyltetrahydrofolate--homocysteine methyltransferase
MKFIHHAAVALRIAAGRESLEFWSENEVLRRRDVDILKQLALELEKGDHTATAELTKKAIAEKIAVERILNEGLIAGMNVVGEKFRVHEIFLPEVLLAAKAMNAGMELLKPLLIKEGVPARGKVVIGSVQGDLHDIGKNLVSIMLKGAGFEVIDLGHDVAPERFVDTAVEREAPVIGMSALLTTTMPVMGRVVELLSERDLRGGIKTIIGGAPVSQDFASQIGADAYGFDAANAVVRVKTLMGIA